MKSFLKSIPPLATNPANEPGPEKKKNGRKKKVKQPKEVKQQQPQPKSQQQPPKKKKKQHIPVALREQVWIARMGRTFEGKCPTTWCQNTVTVFDFQSGHNIPESKGGPTTLQNLIPLCSRCNQSMGNEYTFDQWCMISDQVEKTVEEVPVQKGWRCCFPSIR